MNSLQNWFSIALLGAGSVVLPLAGQTPSTNANRFTHLDEFSDPFYVGSHFPKLVTPQWVGEDGVEVVVTLGIDDMSGHQNYERYLRPILDRLKVIDGRAPVSIFSNSP